VATAPGRYIVYNGKIGCEKKSEIQITLNSGSTAPAPVELIVVGNSGIACGAGGTVELIVTKPVSGTIVWYRDEKKAASGTDYTEKNAGARTSRYQCKFGQCALRWPGYAHLRRLSASGYRLCNDNTPKADSISK
jgi:hypothetical protein